MSRGTRNERGGREEKEEWVYMCSLVQGGGKFTRTDALSNLRARAYIKIWTQLYGYTLIYIRERENIIYPKPFFVYDKKIYISDTLIYELIKR